MTFQNFLSRVPKWNENIVTEETKRIVEASNCPYLEDLLNMCTYYTIKNSYFYSCFSKTKKD